MSSKALLSCCGLVTLLSAACTPEVKVIDIQPTTVSFDMRDQSKTLAASALDISNKKVPGQTLSFRSENAAVATVDESGTVKPVSDGTVAIIVEAPNKVAGEAFIKVCLPREIACVPADKLDLRVGTGGPIRCEVRDCKDKPMTIPVKYEAVKKDIVTVSGDNYFMGAAVGDTEAIARALTFEKHVAIHVAEAITPENSHRGGGGGGGGSAAKPQSDRTPNKGGFNHILENMKF